MQKGNTSIILFIIFIANEHFHQGKTDIGMVVSIQFLSQNHNGNLKKKTLTGDIRCGQKAILKNSVLLYIQ